MGIFSRLFGPKASPTDEAIKRGITVTDVERDIPHFSRNNADVTLEHGTCTRYSIARQGNAPATWTMLQRTDIDANVPQTYAIGYYVLTVSGTLPAGMFDVLQELAAEFPEDFFEFEGTATEVAVFWDEFSAEEVQRLHDVLQRLARW